MHDEIQIARKKTRRKSRKFRPTSQSRSKQSLPCPSKFSHARRYDCTVPWSCHIENHHVYSAISSACIRAVAFSLPCSYCCVRFQPPSTPNFQPFAALLSYHRTTSFQISSIALYQERFLRTATSCLAKPRFLATSSPPKKKNIVLQNFSLGRDTQHSPEGTAFRRERKRHCAARRRSGRLTARAASR